MSSVETVTVLFTDLVGSTGLATRVGPAVAEELRREHFTLLRKAIDETSGSEVKNLGDGLMVVFASVSSAVDCAVSIQQRLERRNRRADDQLSVRIGISHGEADLDAGDYFGPPVVEASRLCNASAGGQILCGELVRMMASGRDAHGFKAVGDLDLKGLPEPVPAHEVTWEPLDGAGAGALPLPARLREVPPVGYVGRRTEREGLAFLWHEAQDGSRRVALVSGEPGIGKTRLATHLAVEAHAQGASVLYGRCDEELVAPYGPWAQALRHYVSEGPEHVLRAHVERHGGELGRLVPDLARRIADAPSPRESDPETERYLLFGAVAGLLEEAAREAPIVLVLDDLHWADRPTLSLLKHVIVHDAAMSLMLLGTYRESDLSRGDPLPELLADLRREDGVTRVPLDGLEEGDVVSIMEAAAGHEMDDTGRRLARAIASETDGNPFYVAELLRHLLEAGALVQGDDGRFRLEGRIEDLGLPQSVREVVGRRIERLGEPAQRVLGVAAVIGRDFDLDLLARVSDTEEDDLLDLLDEAVAASVVNESADRLGRFTFAHALISHTLYEDLGRTRRTRLHRRIADALEEMCGDDPGARVSELARHWMQAVAPGEPAKALDYARRAGERALSELAPSEALVWFEQAVELAGEETGAADRCDLLIGLGEAQRQVGDPAFRESLLEAGRLADQLGDADRAGTAAVANNRGTTSQFGEVDDERLGALERAVELDGLTNPARCARLISLQCMELQFDPDHERRRALADEALALARDAGEPRTLVHVMLAWFQATWGPDTLGARRELVEELAALAEELGDPALQVLAVSDQLNVYAEAGEVEEADAAASRMRRLADELGQPTLRWFTTYWSAGLQLLHGDLAAAERLAEEALSIGNASGQADAPMLYGGLICAARSYQSRSDEIVELMEQSIEANPRIPAWRAGLSGVYGWLGRPEAAAAIVRDGAKDGFAHIPHDQVYLTTLALYTEGAHQGDVTEAAALLFDLLEPYADQVVWNGASAYGHARMYLGMLAATVGRDERADEALAWACEFHERNDMPLWTARGRLAWAETLVRRGEAERARAEADRVLALSRENGYATFETRAAAILETGARAL